MIKTNLLAIKEFHGDLKHKKNTNRKMNKNVKKVHQEKRLWTKHFDHRDKKLTLHSDL